MKKLLALSLLMLLVPQMAVAAAFDITEDAIKVIIKESEEAGANPARLLAYSEKYLTDNAKTQINIAFRGADDKVTDIVDIKTKDEIIKELKVKTHANDEKVLQQDFSYHLVKTVIAADKQSAVARYTMKGKALLQKTVGADIYKVKVTLAGKCLDRYVIADTPHPKVEGSICDLETKMIQAY